MNSSKAHALVRHSTLATLLVGAALLMGACSTAPVAGVTGASSDKTYTYSELHQMMVKIAREPELVSSMGPIADTPPVLADLGVSTTLAVNP